MPLATHPDVLAMLAQAGFQPDNPEPYRSDDRSWHHYHYRIGPQDGPGFRVFLQDHNRQGCPTRCCLRVVLERGQARRPRHAFHLRGARRILTHLPALVQAAQALEAIYQSPA